MPRESNEVKTKKQEMIKVQKQNEKLLKMIADEREKMEGYKQIAQVHSAYISILLRRLEATKDNMINVAASEVKEALEKYEARAIQTDDGYGLYCGIIE